MHNWWDESEWPSYDIAKWSMHVNMQTADRATVEPTDSCNDAPLLAFFLHKPTNCARWTNRRCYAHSISRENRKEDWKMSFCNALTVSLVTRCDFWVQVGTSNSSMVIEDIFRSASIVNLRDASWWERSGMHSTQSLVPHALADVDCESASSVSHQNATCFALDDCWAGGNSIDGKTHVRRNIVKRRIE